MSHPILSRSFRLMIMGQCNNGGSLSPFCDGANVAETSILSDKHLPKLNCSLENNIVNEYQKAHEVCWVDANVSYVMAIPVYVHCQHLKYTQKVSKFKRCRTNNT